MSEVNKAAAREIIAMFGSGDVSGAEALIARDAVEHQGMPGMDTSGVEGIKRLIAVFHVAFPDLHVHIEDIIAEGRALGRVGQPGDDAAARRRARLSGWSDRRAGSARMEPSLAG